MPKQERENAVYRNNSKSLLSRLERRVLLSVTATYIGHCVLGLTHTPYAFGGTPFEHRCGRLRNI